MQAATNDFSAVAAEALPDLSDTGIADFLRERGGDLEREVRTMEAAENWTRDRVASIQGDLARLAERIGEIDMTNISQETHNRLIVLLGYISSGRALKLLSWIEESSPNFVARTAAEAQMLAVVDTLQAGAARLFVERFEVLDRLHLLSRIFSEERLATLSDVLAILGGRADPDDDGGDESDDDDTGQA